MYYKSVNENVTDAKTPDLLLLFPVCNTFVGEVVTLPPTVSAMEQKCTLSPESL
jgi:hypothetical protein